MSNITVLDKANAAKRLLEHDDFRLIMSAIETDIFDGFRKVAIGDAEKLQNIHALSHGFNLVNDRCTKYIEAAVFEARKDAFDDE
jgi:hypothetical protein